MRCFLPLRSGRIATRFVTRLSFFPRFERDPLFLPHPLWPFSQEGKMEKRRRWFLLAAGAHVVGKLRVARKEKQ